MGGKLTEEEIENFLSLLPFVCTTAVETGTYKGWSTKILSKFFQTVYTIEISEKLLQEAVTNNSDCKNIKYIQGDSTESLKKLKIKDNCLCFLDAHISGIDSSWNKKEQVPLLKELETVLENFTGKLALIIDDVRLFDNFSDWSGITEENILCIISRYRRVRSSYVKDDRFYIIC